MDQRSGEILKQVHPDLVKVLENSSQEPQPFLCIYGLRTLEAEETAVATGHSTTLHSRHLPNKDGLSCAVDIAALIDGVVSFAPGHETDVFGQITDQIKASAANQKIEIQCGIDWVSFKDYGHIQLPWGQYP